MVTHISSQQQLDNLINTNCNPNTIAWFLSHAQYESGLWLETIPKEDALEFSNAEFSSAVCSRLHLYQNTIIPGTACSCKKKILIDRYGHHISTGCNIDATRHKLHNNLLHLLSRLCSYSGLYNIIEETDCFKGVDPDENKRPDMRVINFPGDDKSLVTDLIVASIFPGVSDLSAPAANTLTVTNAKKPLRSAKKAFQDKERKYGTIAEQNNLRFLPLPIESSGAMHPSTLQFVTTVAKHASDFKKIPEKTILNYMLRAISANVQKSIAKSIISRSLHINSRNSSAFLTDEYLLSFEDQGFSM